MIGGDDMVKSKKNLQDRMTSMKPYFKGVEMYNEALIVKVVFPNNWKAYDSQDGKIKVTPSDSNPNESYYYANSEEASYNDIFDLIEETIKANQDIILKLELLKKKIEELKEVFSSHSYDELCSLSFDFKQCKRKYTKKEKAPQNANKGHSEQSDNMSGNTTCEMNTSNSKLGDIDNDSK